MSKPRVSAVLVLAALAVAAAAPRALVAQGGEPKLVPTPLDPAGADWKGLVMEAPEGATVKDSLGNASVVKGDTFKVDLSGRAADVAARRKEIEANKAVKLKKFHVDKPDELLYETEVGGKSEFHFLVNLKVGDKSFSAEDTLGSRYTRADVDRMVRCVKTLKRS